MKYLDLELHFGTHRSSSKFNSFLCYVLMLLYIHLCHSSTFRNHLTNLLLQHSQCITCALVQISCVICVCAFTAHDVYHLSLESFQSLRSHHPPLIHWHLSISLYSHTPPFIVSAAGARRTDPYIVIKCVSLSSRAHLSA